MFRAALWKRKAWLQDSPRDLNNNKSNPEWCDTFCRVETRMCPDVENWWFKMFRWLHRKDFNLKKKKAVFFEQKHSILPEWSRWCVLLCFLSLHDCEACCKRNRDASKTILKSPICSSRGVTWPDSVIGQFSKAVVQFELTSWLRSFYFYQHLYSGAPVVSHSADSYHRPSPCAPRCRTSACSSQWFPYWPCGDARCGSGTSPTSSPSHPAGPSGSLKQTDGERKKDKQPAVTHCSDLSLSSLSSALFNAQLNTKQWSFSLCVTSLEHTMSTIQYNTCSKTILPL